MPERREGFSPQEGTSSPTTEKRKGRGRRERRRKDRERKGRTGGSDTEKVTVVPRPGSEKHPDPTPDVSSTPPVTSGTTASTPDTSRASGTTKPPDVVKADARAPSVDVSDDDDDDDGDVAVPTTSAPSPSPTSSLDSATPVSDKDTRYIFIPGGEGIDDKAKKWLQKGGRGLGFLGLGSLGVLAHLFRITARTAHQAYDGILYFAEKALYEHSGAKNTIPWKWFLTPPEEPEYLKAKKRLEEMQKRSGGGGGDKRR